MILMIIIHKKTCLPLTLDLSKRTNKKKNYNNNNINVVSNLTINKYEMPVLYCGNMSLMDLSRFLEKLINFS